MAKDFEEVTNFDIEVCGYVGFGGHVLGYVLQLLIAVIDPLDPTSTNSKYVTCPLTPLPL